MGFMEAASKSAITKIVLVLVLIGAILLAVLLPMSFAKVNYDEYGLLYSTASRTILDREAVGPGKYFVGLGHDFHRFPSMFQSIEFSALALQEGRGRGPQSVRTADKFVNTLELSFQYTLLSESMYDLFDQYKFEYEQYFIRDAIGAFADVGPKFMAEDFFTKRQEFEDTLFDALDAVLRTRFAKLEGLQLLSVIFDDKIEAQLLNDQVRNETNVLITVTNDLLVVTSYWEREKEKVLASITSELARFGEETKQQLVAWDLIIDTIQKNTETTVRRISAETEKQLTEYRQETENQRLNIFSNVTLIKKETERVLAIMEAEISLNKAKHIAHLNTIASDAATNVSRILADANAAVEEVEQGLYTAHVAEVKQDLGLTSEDIVKYEWLAALGELSASRVYLDYKKPAFASVPTPPAQ